MRVLWLVLVVLLSKQSATGGRAAAERVVAYASASCTCCRAWCDHLRANGFEVDLVTVENLASVPDAHAVPPEGRSCHMATVGDYVVVGHVPASAIKRLLRDRPKVRGLSVPGMPVGSPGMELPDAPPDPFHVMSFDGPGDPMSVFE